jgi:acetylornithine deacetylase/succinyl-diaminopimelate desuccinylase-like protein
VDPAHELAQLVRLPTVSSDPACAGALRVCARRLAERLRRAGLAHVRLLTPARHPLVVAGNRHVPDRPTVLLYTHYDVQPAGSPEDWSSPPFQPTRRENSLYGRGASDDKGQLLCHVLAVERFLRRGDAPINVVIILDGEEEIGSPGLAAVLRLVAHRTPITAALISDTRMLAPGRPSLTIGLRGSLALELTLRGPARDLHAGAFGGAVHNPLQVLCEVLAGLHTPDGRIALPGIYRRVLPTPAAARSVRSDREILAEAGVTEGWGEPGRTAYERTVARPALTLNGLTGGHQGPGAKAVLPAEASAKLSFRLVPEQQPAEVERALRRHLAAAVPPTIRWGLVRQGVTPPVHLDPRDAAHRAASRAVVRVWGRPPVLLRSGGSILAARLLAGELRTPTVLLGFALPDDSQHGPNEKFYLPHLTLGAATVEAFLRDVGWFSASAGRRARAKAVAAGRPRSSGPPSPRANPHSTSHRHDANASKQSTG